MDDEKVDYLNEDFDQTIEELDTLSELDIVKIEINEGLEEALKELDSLHDQFSTEDSAQLLDLCKTTVIESITGQFGLAGMFIQAKDGGSVTTAHNFENGITATESDKEKYDAYKANNDGSKRWEDTRKEVGYDGPLQKKRNAASETVIDEYTGKPIPKENAVIDHVVSAKEIESNAKNHLFKTPEERAKMATNDKNLAWTEKRANDSKGKQEMKDWLDKPNPNNPNETNEERYKIDRKRALKRDAKARKYLKTEITVAAAKKYGAELMCDRQDLI